MRDTRYALALCIRLLAESSSTLGSSSAGVVEVWYQDSRWGCLERMTSGV